MESTLYIPHIDETVMRTLELLAQKEHTSVEEIVRQYLMKLKAKNIPQSEQAKKIRKKEAISKLAGIWSDKDLQEFENATAPFREIDPTLWQ
jgi:hypothetical protein